MCLKAGIGSFNDDYNNMLMGMFANYLTTFSKTNFVLIDTEENQKVKINLWLTMKY